MAATRAARYAGDHHHDPGGGDAKREAFEAGTTAFLLKPVNIEDFKRLLGRYIGLAAK